MPHFAAAPFDQLDQDLFVLLFYPLRSQALVEGLCVLLLAQETIRTEFRHLVRIGFQAVKYSAYQEQCMGCHVH